MEDISDEAKAAMLENQFDAVEVNPIHSIGFDEVGREIMEPCDCNPACSGREWGVYFHAKGGELFWLNDFALRETARAWARVIARQYQLMERER